MELYEDLAVWAVLGAATNGLARGIRNKPLNFRPLGYAYAAFIGIGIGLVADTARTQQNEFASKRLSALIAAREARESQQ